MEKDWARLKMTLEGLTYALPSVQWSRTLRSIRLLNNNKSEVPPHRDWNVEEPLFEVPPLQDWNVEELLFEVPPLQDWNVEELLFEVPPLRDWNVEELLFQVLTAPSAENRLPVTSPQTSSASEATESAAVQVTARIAVNGEVTI